MKRPVNGSAYQCGAMFIPETHLPIPVFGSNVEQALNSLCEKSTPSSLGKYTLHMMPLLLLIRQQDRRTP